MDALNKFLRALGGSGEEVNQKGDRYGNAYGALALPQYTVITKEGGGWIATTTAAVASVIAIPTTTAMFTLWDGEADTGKSYIIDRLFFATWANDPEHEGDATLFVCMHPVGMAAPTADITAIKSLAGKANYSGSARLDVGATVVNDGWYPWGDSVHTDTDENGVCAVSVPVDGRIILPPSAGLSLSVVCNDADVTVTCGFQWYEKVLDLG